VSTYLHSADYWPKLDNMDNNSINLEVINRLRTAIDLLWMVPLELGHHRSEMLSKKQPTLWLGELASFQKVKHTFLILNILLTLSVPSPGEAQYLRFSEQVE